MEFAPPLFVYVGGRRLAYEEVTPDLPEGTVLLLCGIGAKRQGWYKQLPVLGERFRALALDYRDVGDSDAATEAYSIRDLADDVYAVACALGIKRASLVGISMGGFIALELALAYPDFIDRLALVVTSAGGATHVSTSSEVMRALMPGDEEVESGEGARRVCSLVAGPGFASAIRRRSRSSSRSRSTTRCTWTLTSASSPRAVRTMSRDGSMSSRRRRL